MITTLKDAANHFLEHRRIAVTGVSRTPAGHGANIVYGRLKERGYQVFAINPNTETIDGDPCYHDLRAVPGGVEAVVIGTSPQHAEETMHEAVELGIADVWMHRSVGGGSVSASATAYGREHGVRVIPGGCPLMFAPTSDGAHKVMCQLLKLTGAVPRKV